MLAWVRHVYLIANTLLCHTVYSKSFYVPLLQHFFTHLSLSILSKCPNHVSLPLSIEFLMLTNLNFLSIDVRLHIPHKTSIIMSFLQLYHVLFFHCPGLTTIEKTLLAWLDNLIYVNIGKRSLNLFLKYYPYDFRRQG